MALLLLQMIQCLLLLLAKTQLFAGLLKADPQIAHHDIQEREGLVGLALLLLQLIQCLLLLLAKTQLF
ncbi:MAG: hypothetical protein ACRDAF_09385, partial [Aeromonas veronii]